MSVSRVISSLGQVLKTKMTRKLCIKSWRFQEQSKTSLQIRFLRATPTCPPTNCIWAIGGQLGGQLGGGAIGGQLGGAIGGQPLNIKYSKLLSQSAETHLPSKSLLHAFQALVQKRGSIRMFQTPLWISIFKLPSAEPRTIASLSNRADPPGKRG